MKRAIDLNCDLGESYGIYSLGEDDGVMPLITSANIACGFHAGDYNVLARTVRKAVRHNTAIGAHPGLPDLQGFGRRQMDVSANDVYNMTLYQIGAVQAFARSENVRAEHVKPHGALYNMASKDRAIADAVAEAVKTADSSLILFGLYGSELTAAGQSIGLSVANEVFADRTYRADGSLTPRSHADALIEDPEKAAERIMRMLTESKTVTADGADIAIEADTICIHGDGPNALLFVQKLHETLLARGVEIKKAGDIHD
ncbi:LamB/YcsF family protein [Salisediminibacterium halotolerans]|uniref:LamB/YcsF family protein n=1 Tax=Salisediminibacterium halotolerans TaxID=517425 RepID=UPI000EB2E6D6|nr:5-oxoprolinase subunit PxpA [Salisediminibacterium halotolerans]RLJ78356.1 UPF0271 protein [Actinophytocola xinjiangensis]RPE88302.1 UPF0271 protein [Salisediminibacterium halotolerans]TWG37332.1 UPF0271 protein [Salisediminibacterium halotolerans]GEL06797.1 UPF0271 protein [Salisediminibacterium halotolerans]